MAKKDLVKLWEQIEKAGGSNAYINDKLRKEGLFVDRQNSDSLSDSELKKYKLALKDEAARKRELKKEAWLAYKETHIVHLGDGVFWNDVIDLDKWDIPNAEKRASENELPPLEKPADLAAALDIPVSELRWLSYHRDAAEKIHYRPFTIPKRDGSQRAIWAPLPKLKNIQRWILREVLEHLPVHGAAHGFLSGRSIYSNALCHIDSKIILRIDIKDFFPTITLPRVKGLFRKAGYREQIATLLALLCTEAPREEVELEGKKYFVSLGPRSLPQGAPTSPAITNALCMRLDRRLAGLAKKLGWRYSRYADDLTFSLPAKHKKAPKLGALMGLVKRVVEDEGFRVNAKKTRVARSGGKQQITGLIVNGKETPRVPRKLKRELRSAVHNLSKGKELREGESIHTMIGYAAYIYMTDPELGEKYLSVLQEIKTKQEESE
ncbi:MAG: RNA-directed DNA polymerase [bacterium]|nr:RNA-directed DNA polymerase [bacterium]